MCDIMVNIKDKIWIYIEENLHQYGLKLTDINEVDVDCIYENIEEFGYSIDFACDEMLHYIKEASFT